MVVAKQATMYHEIAFKASIFADDRVLLGLTLAGIFWQLVRWERGTRHIHKSGKRNCNKRLCEQLKSHVATKLGFALALKAINLVHIACFVVPAVHKGCGWV